MRKLTAHLKKIGAIAMNQEFDFARLVELCERTHRGMQLHAVPNC